MENDTPLQKIEMSWQMPVRSGLKAGYRPVHGLVYPDQAGRWMPGWFDMDSAGRLGASESMAPPPPPE